MSPILDTPASTSGDGLTCSLWVESADLSDECKGDATDDVITWATQLASDTLYLFSGRIYPGICEDVVRPCSMRGDLNPGPSNPPGYNGGRAGLYSWGPWTWLPAWGGCTCSLNGSFGCCPCNQVRLPCEPVTAITQVRIDGEVLDPSAYRVDAPGWLVRLDGEGWPCCQSLILEATEPNTFEVQYNFGREIPSVGAGLAGLLACELIAGSSDGECALPPNVQQLVRQGTTYKIVDPQEAFDNGRTGIKAIDSWLSAINPHKVKSPAKVWSPRSTARAHRNG